MIALALLTVSYVKAEAIEPTDTTLFEQLNDAVVIGVKLPSTAPFAVSNVSKEELENFSSSGQELPALFSRTPGITFSSDNGTGTGTTSMRIRGAGSTRINVTLDGVPLNSPEDQSVFWANMNSYASFLKGVQIQRGVGSSTNGDGAFGGTVSLLTREISYKPYAEVTFSYGSYNTNREAVSFSSGLLGKRFVIDGSFGTTGTDGYIHGTSGRSGSWLGSLSFLGDNFIIKYRNVGNFENTGQAWNGVTAGNNDLSLMEGTFGTHTGIKTYSDMYNVGLGQYNSLYEALDYEDGEFKKDADGNYLTHRYQLKDGTLWPKTTDNFLQDHNILSASWNINGYWTTALSLHYTYGDGYYEEFRPDNKLKTFGFTPFVDSGGNYIERSDFIRKKSLTQHTGGFVYNLNYNREGWSVLAGVNGQFFKCHHFGYLTYVGNDDLEKKTGVPYQYYNSESNKNDVSVFVKASYDFRNGWNVFADLQYRYVGYRTDGVNDKFKKQPDGTYKNQVLNINENYNFFNPKIGASYTSGGHKTYISAAIANREPERNNFTDNDNYEYPKPERLYDIELGYEYSGKIFEAGVNLYYMHYKDQFVQTGEKSDIGELLTTNIAASYRTGVELQASVDPLEWMTIEANAALSANRILDFDEVVEDWDLATEPYTRKIHYDNSTLAFSPSAIVNAAVDFHYKAARAVIRTSYVSRQYLDNTQNIDRSLPGYSTTGIDLGYTFRFRKAVKALELGLQFGNIFNSHYATSGWVYSAICDSAGHSNDNRYYQIGFIPMAGFTAMGNIKIRF